MKKRLYASAAVALVAIGALATTLNAGSEDPMPAAEHVDLPRFMGDWYVIAHIPTFIEKDAYDALESYSLRDDGRIQTVYTQRKGGFNGPMMTMQPVATVREGTGNAVWGMQFIWPIKAEYVIAHVSEDYAHTIVARSKRDYAWIMARTPAIPEATYSALVERVRALGYDTAQLREVPQRSLQEREDRRD